jgi:hypothetical protein
MCNSCGCKPKSSCEDTKEKKADACKTEKPKSDSCCTPPKKDSCCGK